MISGRKDRDARCFYCRGQMHNSGVVPHVQVTPPKSFCGLPHCELSCSVQNSNAKSAPYLLSENVVLSAAENDQPTLRKIGQDSSANLHKAFQRPSLSRHF